MPKKIKFVTILGAAAALIALIVLPIDQYVANNSDNLFRSLVLEALIYWAVLIISGAILISFLVDNDGDFVTSLDLSDLAAGLMYACFIAYGINLVFSSSFKISNAKNLKKYSGVAAIVDDNWVQINGPIGDLTLKSVNQIAYSNDIKVVELHSGGGLIASALSVASIIDRNKITTVVKGECASACVLIAVSGKQLFVSPDASFGFHNASSISQPESELGKYNSMVASKTMFSFLKKNGIPSDIIKKAESTPANQMYYVTGADLIRRGIAIRLNE